ncbi:MAG: hypothetical protein FWC39_04740 [Bacteroidetes bacterium]|nr:hypothetical protein [Bacteroidota bacterium]
MTQKEELIEFFDTEKDAQKLIVKYEENINFFNDLSKNGCQDDREFALHTKLFSYVASLDKAGYYTKALNVLDEAENDLKWLKLSKWHETYSEGVLFFRGVCWAHLKKHKKSSTYFKQLVKKNPTNDNFVGWYKSTKKHRINDIANVITWTTVSLYIVKIILDITNILQIPMLVGTFALIIGLGSWGVSYIWGKIIDKQKVKIKI